MLDTGGEEASSSSSSCEIRVLRVFIITGRYFSSRERGKGGEGARRLFPLLLLGENFLNSSLHRIKLRKGESFLGYGEEKKEAEAEAEATEEAEVAGKEPSTTHDY